MQFSFRISSQTLTSIVTEQDFEKTDEWLREAHPYFAAKPTVQIMKRQQAPSSSNSSGTVPVDSKPQMTIKEREANYAKARAAIFSDEDQSNNARNPPTNSKPGGSNAKGSKNVNTRNNNKK